jgi:hypothetical protein
MKRGSRPDVIHAAAGARAQRCITTLTKSIVSESYVLYRPAARRPLTARSTTRTPDRVSQNQVSYPANAWYRLPRLTFFRSTPPSIIANVTLSISTAKLRAVVPGEGHQRNFPLDNRLYLVSQNILSGCVIGLVDG